MELECCLLVKFLEKVDKIKYKEYLNKCGKYVRVSVFLFNGSCD